MKASDLLKKKKTLIIDTWIGKLKEEVPPVLNHEKSVIENSIPDLLDAIVVQLDKKEKDQVIFNSKKHGLQRSSFKEYSLWQIVREYNILKETILEEFKKDPDSTLEDRETVTKAIDQAIEQSVEVYYVVKENIQIDARKIAEKKAAELQLTDRNRNEFIDSISHDLNNPLGIIKTCVNLLERDIEVEQVGIILNMIKKSTQQAEALISDFLKTGQITDDEHLPVERKIVDVLDDLDKETNIYRYSQKREIHFSSESDKILFNCDISLIRRAYHNLMNNALKYSNKSQVNVTCNKTGDGLEIIVHNFGNMIPADVMKNIFNRYYRYNKESKGWGIGLAFVKKVAQAHQGTVTVDSSVTEGTKFRLFIPEYNESELTS